MHFYGYQKVRTILTHPMVLAYWSLSISKAFIGERVLNFVAGIETT